MEREVDAYVRRKFETAIKEVELVQMEDLDLKNHLSGLRQNLLRVIHSAVILLGVTHTDLHHDIRLDKALHCTW